jgi:xylan 1,4-beta-xylosidase
MPHATTFRCDLDQPGHAFPHFWEHTVGSGHAPLALRADWQMQIRRCHRELGFRHVRFHALLSDEMGTLVREDNQPIYSFLNADLILDFLLSIGMRPFVELSFMPRAIASGRKTVFSYQANVTPPKNYRAWETLIHKLAAHWVNRYGVNEVRNWFFEVWNEPNLKAFWTGTRREYFELYRATAIALKRIDPLLKVGGPATAKNEWVPALLNFCVSHRVPIDFVTTHHYPTDAFGKPGADTRTQLRRAPKDVMRTDVERVRAQAGGLPVYYTEWNISSNPRDRLHDETFAAAYAVKIVLGNSALVDGYSFWTFSDIFNENYFPSVPFHGGFGLLNIHGIPKPVYRAFELLHHLGTKSLNVAGTHSTVEAWAFRKRKTVTAMLINHAMPGRPIRSETVTVRFAGSARPRRSYLETIDRDHANPKTIWESMGSPEYLATAQIEKLERASRLERKRLNWSYHAGETAIRVRLKPHSVAAVTCEFA